MASPMRKKRAWSSREEDAESKETAAFEASVAAAKDTAAKSGAFLSSVKEDLTDHQRWLRAQSAAVERDRQRHERWLQKQREQQLAAANRERTRKRRQLARQRAFKSVQQALLNGGALVWSWNVFVVSQIVDGSKFLGASIAHGIAYGVQQIQAGGRWIEAQLGFAARKAGEGFSSGVSWSGATARRSARASAAALSSGAALVASKLGRSLSAASGTGGGLALAATKASALGAAGQRGFASGVRWSKERAIALAPAVYARVVEVRRRAGHLTRTRAADADEVIFLPPPGASVHVIEVYGPHAEGAKLFGRPANDPWKPSDVPPVPEIYGPFREGFFAGSALPNEQHYETDDAASVSARADGPSFAQQAGAQATALAVQGRVLADRAGVHIRIQADRLRAWAETRPWAKTEAWAGVEAWARTRGFDLSQMMIIAGAILLVCGGLLLGGGLLMRGDGRAPTVANIAPEETFSGITWAFAEPSLSLPERAVFTLSGTPESFLINGLSITGFNQADQPVTGLEGVLKPDVQRPELKLALKVESLPVPDGSKGETGVATALPAPGTVPAHTPFRLVFPFPPEATSGEDGITVEEFFDSYGGLLLTLRYEIDGVEKSVIQYLDPAMLKAQLDEVSAEAAGG